MTAAPTSAPSQRRSQVASEATASSTTSQNPVGTTRPTGSRCTSRSIHTSPTVSQAKSRYAGSAAQPPRSPTDQAASAPSPPVAPGRVVGIVLGDAVATGGQLATGEAPHHPQRQGRDDDDPDRGHA